jgi:hypothetical protein
MLLTGSVSLSFRYQTPSAVQFIRERPKFGQEFLTFMGFTIDCEPFSEILCCRKSISRRPSNIKHCDYLLTRYDQNSGLNLNRLCMCVECLIGMQC